MVRLHVELSHVSSGNSVVDDRSCLRILVSPSLIHGKALVVSLADNNQAELRLPVLDSFDLTLIHVLKLFYAFLDSLELLVQYLKKQF